MKIEQIAFNDDPGLKQVRETVFIQEQNVPVELEWDDEDQTALHFVAKDQSGKVIGTARLLANGHIGRMAVLKEWRNQGVGTELLKNVLNSAKQLGLASVFLHAQTSAIDFYHKMGFATEGDVFLDAGIPHQTMKLQLSRN